MRDYLLFRSGVDFIIVTVYLPASQILEAPSLIPETPAEPAERMERISIMDDEEIIRTVAVVSLARFGYKVDKANHGNEAVEKCRAAYDNGTP